MIGYPDAWSPSTNGDVVGTPMLIAGISADSLEKMRGAAQGRDRDDAADDDDVHSRGPRQSDGAERAAVVHATAPAADAAVRGGGGGAADRAKRSASRRSCTTPASARCSSRAAASTGRSSSRRATPARTRVPTVVVAGEHYNNLIRLLQNRVPVKVRVNVQGRYFTQRHERLQRHRRAAGHRSARSRTKS